MVALQRRRWLLGGAACLALPALSQRGPAGPLRITNAYPPGGVSDEVARALAERIGRARDTPVTVDHLPGAGGALALEALARGRPDGRWLVFCAINPLTVLPHLAPQRYAALRGVVPVTAVMATPALVLGTPALPVAHFDELLALAQRRPGQLRWASSGVATTGHLLMEHVCRAAAVDIVHVPYKGGGQQINDALAGHFELLSSNVAAMQLALVAQRRLTALAVGAPAPLAALPGVPTLAALGLPAANLGSVFALFAPPHTPEGDTRQWQQQVDAALHEPALQQRLLNAGQQPLGGPAEALSERIAREQALHRELLLARPQAFR